MVLIKISLLFASFCFGFVFNLDILTTNLIDNLQGDPHLLAEDFTEKSKEFIDKQIKNYIELLTGNGVYTYNKKKRSLLDDITKRGSETYIIEGFTPTVNIPITYPNDIQLFQQHSRTFVAALQSSSPKENANFFKIFSYSNETFIEEHKIAVENATKISLLTQKNVTFIAIAERSSLNTSTVYQFDSSGLNKIQKIEMHEPSDVILWEMHHEIYLAIGQFTAYKNHTTTYETEIPIYKWLGKHFDVIQSIPGQGVKKITPFQIGTGWYLAIANYRNNLGNTKIYSDLYKFDYQLEKFVLHQRLLTKGCKDIKVFNFGLSNQQSDTFLIIANSVKNAEISENGQSDYSIIYKFVDEYCIPFQSLILSQVEAWEIAHGPNHEFVLFARTRYEGLKSFQYDGWSFKEVLVRNPHILTGSSIKSVRTTIWQKHVTLVISNKNNNGNTINMYKVNYKQENSLGETYKNLINWCDDGLKKIESLSNGNLFDIILGNARGDIDEVKENQNIAGKIENLTLLLNQIDVKVELPSFLTVDEIFFNNVTIISDLKASNLNDRPVDDFFSNILNIDQDLNFDEITFESLTVNKSLEVDSVKGHGVQDLLHSTDDAVLDFVTITGKLLAPEGVTIGGHLNDIAINHSLLQKVGNQSFDEPFLINEMIVNGIDIDLINGLNLSKKVDSLGNESKISHIENLIVRNLTIGDYLNDIDVPTLHKYALRKNGVQVITGNFTFNKMNVENFKVLGKVNNRNLANLIPTDNGDVFLKQDLIFTNSTPHFTKLKIKNSLNHIKIINGKLDILFKNQKEEQEILGNKTFDDVIIHHAIHLQGHINSKHLEKMNPVVSIDEILFLQNDKFFDKIEIEGFVTCDDIISTSGKYSLTNLEKRGLSLHATSIKPRLNFVQQLNSERVFVDTINGRDINQFVVVGTDRTQVIEGTKTFLGDLTIDGSSKALKINNVDVENWENKILMIHGNQTIAGKHRIKSMITDTVFCEVCKINKNLTIDMSNDLTIKNLEVDVVSAEQIFVKGSVNDFNFGELVNDTVTINSSKPIKGHKYFNSLLINQLKIDNGIAIPDALDSLIINEPLELDNAQIKNLHFEKHCNNMPRDQFGQKIDSISMPDLFFDQFIIHGNAFVSNNKINNLELDDLVENTVKINEPHFFHNATFKENLITNIVHLNGQAERLDLDNLLLESDVPLTVSSSKFFVNLTVNGYIKFDQGVNQLNLTEFCQFTTSDNINKNVTVTGNTFFSKGPKVKILNNKNVKLISEKAWFDKLATTLTGFITFDNVVFEDHIKLEGLLNEVNLSFFNNDYFSKTKNQTITATLSFENDLIFKNNLTVPRIVSSGLINGLNLNEFVRTALIDGLDQVFETVPYFENCTIKNLTGDFTVNNFDLSKDLMRLDKVNLVTGIKNFDNVTIKSLNLDKNILIQDVDVLNWIKNAVLKTTNFNITSTKVFRNAIFRNGLYLSKSLNGIQFDDQHILLRNVPQDITGFKTFSVGPIDTLDFKSIKLKGLINGVDIANLIHNQAYKNQDNIFKTTMNLANNITTRNLVIKKKFLGVNMTELLSNVTNLGFLNNLVEQYENLLKMSFHLKEAIKKQAFFLHDYKIIQKMPIGNSRIIKGVDGVHRIGTLTQKRTEMLLYVWDSQNEQFKINATINFVERVNVVREIFNGHYLFTENLAKGHLIQMPNFVEKLTITTNTTVDSVSFELPTNEICTVLIYFHSPSQIFCLLNDKIELKQTLIESGKALTASVTDIRGITHLAVITQSNDFMESHIDLWRYNTTSAKFDLIQMIFEAYPQSVSLVMYKNANYLAIASGHLQNVMYSGRIEIYRFDQDNTEFSAWQSIELQAPMSVEFDVLPTTELVLYVLNENPIEPFQVFRFEGIAGFQLAFTGSAFPEVGYMNRLESNGKNLILAQGYNELTVVEAVFKGERLV